MHSRARRARSAAFWAGYNAFRRDDIGQWFSEKWVRISAEGNILGPCGDRANREGKPKCLPHGEYLRSQNPWKH